MMLLFDSIIRQRSAVCAYNRTPDVGEIAGLVHLGKASFCRYFKKQTKMTFTDFVNQYRIAQAKTCLLQDSSVSDVCYQVGFESLSYFNKLFKQHMGVNPSAFKKQVMPFPDSPSRQYE
ncbi:MAG: AraC family transcriptional regulator [Saprospiraceae bacterium]